MDVRSARSAKAFALLLVSAALGSCVWLRTATRIESGACRGCNVLLVTIDTLRVDRVGAFGSALGLTPNIDRLAAEGFRATRTYTSAPLTLPAHASILTATQPPVHGLRTNGLFRLGPGAPTLATVLKNAGYRTGAFVGSFVLDARFGLNRGFDEYDDRYGERQAGDTEGAERRAEDVIKPALAWIIGTPRIPTPESPPPQIPNPKSQIPWMAWLHLYDPHEPYRAPEPYASRYAPYDAEVAYTDAMLGRLVDTLREAGQLDRTLVAIAADHGESLGEHGERTHGVFAYDVTIRVPWLIWAGGRVNGASDALVRLVDLSPTLLDLVGVPPPAEFDGTSILPRVHDRSRELPSYFEAMDANLTRNWAPLSGIVSGDHKLVDLPAPELYDLRADPSESKNIFSSDPERARTLDAVLKTVVGAFASRGTAAEKTTLSAEARQRLQALGYVAASAGPGKRIYTDADDPKRLIGPANELNDALAAFRRGDRQQGLAAARALAERYPSFSTAYGVVASMQHDSGDLGAAIATLETLVKRGEADQSVLVVLAGYLMEAGRLPQSVDLLEAVVADHPDYADAFNVLGVALSRMGQHTRAQAAWRRVVELDPTSATAYENLGVDALSQGDLADALGQLTRALELDPRLARAHNAIASTYQRMGRRDDAVAHWKTALDIEPGLFDALYNIGTVLHDSGRTDEARPYLERFVRDAPPSRYAADIQRLRVMLQRGTPR
jgi:arylsulfatase A-like enzyme/Tfp pilus assembly protein PilF